MIRPSPLCGLGDLIETGGPEDWFCAGALLGIVARMEYRPASARRTLRQHPTLHTSRTEQGRTRALRQLQSTGGGRNAGNPVEALAALAGTRAQ